VTALPPLAFAVVATLSMLGLALALATLLDLIERAKETMNEHDDDPRRDGGQW
jgi:hypothetical protein